MIKYSLIAAIADNLIIGNGNSMPWHVPADLKLFKQLTSGNIIIMGRKTFESIGSALPGRTTLVVTGSPDAFMSGAGTSGIEAFGTIDAALEAAGKIAEKSTPPARIFIAGGASIYAQTISGAERLYLSRIPGNFEGDTRFPEFRSGGWEKESSEDRGSFIFEVYRKKQ